MRVSATGTMAAILEKHNFWAPFWSDFGDQVATTLLFGRPGAQRGDQKAMETEDWKKELRLTPTGPKIRGGSLKELRLRMATGTRSSTRRRDPGPRTRDLEQGLQ